MAPLEDLQSRDLAWISDFIMQQMVILMRPLMDQLQETDAAAEQALRMVQRLSVDVTEIRGDVERSSKYLTILRQGLGVQNEGKCLLQSNLEANTRTLQRLDLQIEGMQSSIRGLEESINQAMQNGRLDKDRQEDFSSKISANSSAVNDLQLKFEKLTLEAASLKNDVLNNEARMDVWQKELRDLRRGQPFPTPTPTKIEDKSSRTGVTTVTSQNIKASTGEPNQWNPMKCFTAVGGDDSDHATTTLPQLSASRQGTIASRSSDRGNGLGTTAAAAAAAADNSSAARLRFTATMGKPESRGRAGL